MFPDPVRLGRALRRRVLRLTPFVDLQVRYDAIDRPQFAYGIYQAARQAKALGYDAMSVLEFGVAGGNGLLAMENVAAVIGAHLGIRIDAYGFDTGQGMPPALDHRDAPFIWRSGQFRMDFEALAARLTTARLVIDDVEAGLKRFVKDMRPAPIGFISFDMDYYSSTRKALALCDEGHDLFLPRPFFYFDDIVGDDSELHCEFIGELLAIREFNDAHPAMKIAPIHGLAAKRVVPDHWHVKTFVLHRFEHPRYCDFVGAKPNWQMPLKAARSRSRTWTPA
ncbi:hypothetical protein [Methylobacterium brachythecii]|uniref:Uncharacterized protein n=1 Tax=Methylobacterium brachythecii TaxID=1176177 RepID=A0A7W6AMH4_9HYPH|nr:hypothetical protein [Methylobacterium brachythecii]MBB3903929.1 hypothetical protein [Methylobacterium brachythecii]GLS42676.1 hypothetical protein GCM10007884_06610 [Methylobacterium brachythecii]